MTQPSVATDYRHLRDDAVRLLSAWQTTDPGQLSLRARYLQHLQEHPDGVAKAGPAEHLTASTLVFDADLRRVLLTHHPKAQAWLQLGGHLEAQDETVHAAAVREVAEESGIAGVRVIPVIAQLDAHRLAEGFGRCREHLDVRFAAVAPAGARPVPSEESIDVAWHDLDAAPGPAAHEVRALAHACLRVLSAHRE